jgi:hypothetical protein
VRVDDVPERLRTLLREAGGDPAAPPAGVAWACFQRLAQDRIDGLDPDWDEDLLLFEAHRDSDGTLTVDVERQYGGEGEMRSLLCRVTAGPDALPGTRGVQLWGRPGTAADEWIGQVEATEHAALLHDPAARAAISASRI